MVCFRQHTTSPHTHNNTNTPNIIIYHLIYRRWQPDRASVVPVGVCPAARRHVHAGARGVLLFKTVYQRPALLPPAQGGAQVCCWWCVCVNAVCVCVCAERRGVCVYVNVCGWVLPLLLQPNKSTHLLLAHLTHKHRDLKLDNTLLHDRVHGPPWIRLCDFGFAKTWHGTDANMKTAIGTPVYMSPQVCVCVVLLCGWLSCHSARSPLSLHTHTHTLTHNTLSSS